MHLINKKFIVILILFFSADTFAQNLDIDVLKGINKNQTEFKDKYLELCASSTTFLSIATPASVLTAGLIKHDKKLQRDGLCMAGAYIVSSIITQGTKRVIDRKRPFETYPFIVKRDDESGGMSMPSGHTSAAFVTATSLSLRFHKWYVVVPSYLWATSVGWSRMYQGVHYPSDVFVGAVIGAGSAWVSYKVQQWHERKITKKNSGLHPSVNL